MPHPFCDLFPRPKPVVAVLHVGPSPGVPGSRGVGAAVDRAVAEARLLVDLGVDGLLVENAHDAPALAGDEVGPEVVAFLTRVAAGVRRHAGRLPVGVRVLHSSRAALAVAHGAGCHFVRVDGWAEDPGEPARFHRYRALLQTDLPALADVRPDGLDDVPALVAAVEAGRPDALLVLGPRVGVPPRPGVVEEAREHAALPLFFGGGVDADAFPAVVDLADGFLVGSGLKERGRWQGPVCEPRVRALVGAAEYARGQEVRQ
ncbi:BtpA/SgcQ family protein [Rubrivirga litoralis]|uniref:BtpA/SgcQ family protein n=1 Tax=Rubrivirga litoralis TaxID=3075598 RepID=A0ABU3BP24_9BACT|nr:BtpA/SgcQ family protein [Rubrivirga sp. F394]MDT0630980.1 BtpA/SgcQ family protein [Rubrivirga sp. F394]